MHACIYGKRKGNGKRRWPYVRRRGVLPLMYGHLLCQDSLFHLSHDC